MTLHRDGIRLLDADEEFGKVMRLARMQAGLSQGELARLANVDASLLARIERGTRRPRAETRRRIEEVIRKIQDEQLGPLLLDLMQDIASVNLRAKVEGIAMPSGWESVMERVHQQLAAVDPTIQKVSHVRNHPLKVVR